MSAKSDSRLAEFLRRVRAGDGDASPVEIVFGQPSMSEVQESIALQFAASVREMGYIEPASGPDGELRSVRVTPEGGEWLDEYDRRDRTLHPRYSS
ncbi:hypothetical protein [Pseudonocardia endophytica]|uniref:Uncharacterized protein n=1 Tax=Pseudonocardia endophytica TaxID=401976 RepID=A0A4R1HRI0_PSEEN|nr:hypothetical protein [Pseudonocardia endophytica]TCK25214.1 hypothetical protein EV378_1014 [Pseudonocardia endophytica]